MNRYRLSCLLSPEANVMSGGQAAGKCSRPTYFADALDHEVAARLGWLEAADKGQNNDDECLAAIERLTGG
jgi:hypothetical protein